MPCDCETKAMRVVGVGSGADQCRATVTVKSKCEQVELPERRQDAEPEEAEPEHIPRGVPENLFKPEDLDRIAIVARPTPLVMLCRVTYEIGVSASANASVVEFSVEGEVFGLPNPISPGESDFVQLAREKPANCEKKKVGKVKLECRGKTIEINKLEVCVLD